MKCLDNIEDNLNQGWYCHPFAFLAYLNSKALSNKDLKVMNGRGL